MVGLGIESVQAQSIRKVVEGAVRFCNAIYKTIFANEKCNSQSDVCVYFADGLVKIFYHE